MHDHKKRQIRHGVEIYLAAHNVGEWQVDVAVVYIDPIEKEAKVEMIENVIV